MERFKTTEKEMKTKAFSKEGLTNSLKVDPREREKQETCAFVTSQIDELDRQMESLEAELDTIQSSMKKSRRGGDWSKQERINEINEVVERHKWHQGRLELILRLLENGSLSPQLVNDIQEDIRYYVDSNQDADFAEDEFIYDDLNLDSTEEVFVHEVLEGAGAANANVTLNDDRESRNSWDGSSITLSPKISSHISSAPSISSLPAASSARKHSLSVNPTTPVTPGTSNLKPAPLPTRPNELKYSSAASTTTNGGLINNGSSTSSPKSITSNTTAQTSTITASPRIGNGKSFSSPLPWSEKIQQQTSMNGIINNNNDFTTAASTPNKGKIATPVPTAATIVSSKVTSKISSPIIKTDKKSLSRVENGVSEKTSTPKVATSTLVNGSVIDATASATTISKSINIENQKPKIVLPPGLQGMINSFEAAKQRLDKPEPISSISKLLEVSFLNCPDSYDASNPTRYAPVNPFPTSPFYPTEPLETLVYYGDKDGKNNTDSKKNSLNNSLAKLISKFDIGTLFYIFYYKQGSYEQLLASKELKKQSWRFHKRYSTWFKRLEGPEVVNDNFEQGTYRFFDFEGLWLERRKPGFKFEYRYLEDEVV